MLQSEKAMQLIIEGHTDSDGQDQHNQILSEKRAESVKIYLVSAGISSSRLSTIGYGESKPAWKKFKITEQSYYVGPAIPLCYSASRLYGSVG